MLNNEEEIRSKILLPYISELGFNLSEISLEKSFKIRLGRSEKIIRGRSDILCRKHDKNLFILEIKKDSLSITKDDVSQGISYSRALVGNIAPFTIISNGKETKIFDTITKRELTGSKIAQESEFWKNGCTIALDEDLRIRYEGLLNFISFTDENMKIFCHEQVNDRIKLISGSISSLKAKYIKSLHIYRPDLRLIFEKFINSNCSVFGIIGNAGVGKTCSMCTLALESLETNFTLFYNGTLIQESVIDTISKDLNLFFSAKNERGIVLNRLDEIARFTKKKVIIFIDAIDEVLSSNFANELSEISYSLGKLNNVKLCISCKLTVWDRFLNTNETINHTSEELSKFSCKPIGQNLPGYHLKEFNDIETNKVISLYKTAFNFKGEITKSVFEKLKNGFFLRIFSEIYKFKEVPNEISDIELIREYILQTLKRTSLDIQTSFRILAQIGESILKHNIGKHQFSQEGISIDKLLDDLDVPHQNQIPQELFDRNILIKSKEEISYHISFYYSKIRDYIICYHSFKLDKIDNNEFYKTLGEFFENYVGESAIKFFIGNASNSKLNTFQNFKIEKLVNYAKYYNEYLDKNMDKIKISFVPKTNGNIGIIIPDDLINKDGYALVPIEQNSTRSYQTDSFNHSISGRLYDSLFKKGVLTVHSSNSELLVRDQDKVIKRNIYKQLKEIIEEGKLFEDGSNILLIEKVVTILYYHNNRLKYPLTIEDILMPRFHQIYPINLNYLRDKLYKFRAAHYYNRIKKERSIIEKLVTAAFNKKEEIPALNITGSFPPYEELYRIVNLLISRGITKLEKHYLPAPDKSIEDVKKEFYSNRQMNTDETKRFQFSSERVKKYMKDLFIIIDKTYRELVESCFPTILAQLNFYNNIPHVYHIYAEEKSNFNIGWYGYKKSNTKTTEVIFKPFRENRDAWSKDGIPILRAFRFSKFIHISNSIQTVPKFNTPKVNENCIIRNTVYDLIINDFRSIFKEYSIHI